MTKLTLRSSQFIQSVELIMMDSSTNLCHLEYSFIWHVEVNHTADSDFTFSIVEHLNMDNFTALKLIDNEGQWTVGYFSSI